MTGNLEEAPFTEFSLRSGRGKVKGGGLLKGGGEVCEVRTGGLVGGEDGFFL